MSSGYSHAEASLHFRLAPSSEDHSGGPGLSNPSDKRLGRSWKKQQKEITAAESASPQNPGTEDAAAGLHPAEYAHATHRQTHQLQLELTR